MCETNRKEKNKNDVCGFPSRSVIQVHLVFTGSSDIGNNKEVRFWLRPVGNS